LSEFAVSDMGSVRGGGEADPLAEADVYLAYGRYQHAEDLIRGALAKDGQHKDLNLKLLEVFLAAKNPSAFDEHAQSMLAWLGSSTDATWEKVAEMGRELSPENPMYQPGTDIQAGAVPDDTLSGEIDFDTRSSPYSARDHGLVSRGGMSHATGDANAPDSMAFNPPEFDADQLPHFKMDSVEPDAIEQDHGLDFDIDGLGLDSIDTADEDSAGDGALADLDEVSTKLDLARAYIDMGDPDGARSILDEVMEEGSDDQKSEARDIMAQIA
jgi:pilus assembly protein FimV